MLEKYAIHNSFRESFEAYCQKDPHLNELSKLKYQSTITGLESLSLDLHGIYILTGGRQVGKSTACKLLIKQCIEAKRFEPRNMLYLPCDEIFDAKELSRILRFYLDSISDNTFLLIIDEVTYVKDWDRVIKSLADAGYFKQGICLLTGSDTNILKDAAMRFPGRRGDASITDFHLYPLTFAEYLQLLSTDKNAELHELAGYFQNYLQHGGYLRAINEHASNQGVIREATYATYEQWIRGDFIKNGKNEEYLLAVLHALFTVGVSQISYSTLTQKIGLVSKETCIDYCRLLTRMDVLFDLQAFDQNKKQGFPRKDRKFHFVDPFIQNTIYRWLAKAGYLHEVSYEPGLVEACVASHCMRRGSSYYFKGSQGEVDVIWQCNDGCKAIEVKWSKQIRAHDLKSLKQFSKSVILGKTPTVGTLENITKMPVYQFLAEL